MRSHASLIRVVLFWCIRGYQTFISPMLPRSCKYYPSCSQYAIDALSEYGVLRGFVLSAWRLLRCNPLSYGGYDPVERQTLFAPKAKAYPATANDEVVSAEKAAGGTREARVTAAIRRRVVVRRGGHTCTLTEGRTAKC